MGMISITSSAPDFIASLSAISFLIVFVFFVIGVFVVTFEKFTLIIWANATKKKWLMGIHIPFTVISTIECVVLVCILHAARWA